MSKGKQKVEVEIGCNTDRLYGTLDQAIEYLKEVRAKYPQASLDEHWTGYEDMYMRFIYLRDETDAEYDHRRKLEEAKRQREIKQRKEEQSRRDKIDQLNKLKKELGIY